MNTYADDVVSRMHQSAIEDPEAWWAENARQIDWYTEPSQILDRSNPPFYRWFRGGVLNTCYNALDRHVSGGRADQVALIYDSAMTGEQRSYTYRQLLDEVALFAGVLARNGVQKGDRVIVYMPNIPEAVVAMLACARLGAIHSMVFGGFAANELSTRIDHCTPRVIVAASCGLEPGRTIPYKPMLNEAIDLSTHKPDRVIIFQRDQLHADLDKPHDRDWVAEMKAASPHDCVPVESEHPLYIAYTSGSTGAPKGVIRDNGGHAVALKWSMKAVFDTDPGEVFFAASDVGWVLGHCYIVYAPLMHGATSVLFEGKPVGTPDSSTYWRMVEQHGIVTLFTAPTALRAIKREDPDGSILRSRDLSSLRTLFLAGERADPNTIEWITDLLDIPVIDNWWQTEAGWPMVANCKGLGLMPIKPGSPTRPVPGWDVRVVDENGQETEPDQMGAIVVRLPMAPGAALSLWNADQRYIDSYMTAFPGYYNTGDAGYRDKDGYFYVMSRTDDIINVAGHRLSTGAMEEVLSAHPAVAECAVIGVADDLKGQKPLGFVCLKAGTTARYEDIIEECARMVRHHIGPVAAYRETIVVERLPKTRSGKILRGTMQKIADNQEFRMPATIDDPAILEEIAVALKEVGLAGNRPD
ncbi:propionyl-CoA synthetase [Phaeovibrio sulfidiphilus]|uniref:Propionyl-CoA synthetase n=1 Tax=Phaeovibrio sulfidiphilus TaxID=1220600 RepID=A0A8J6YN62_9PROT|nr:propionyl-CoA synthetase [Phaeovibrio sulfidiphilus]MBE1237858.1 propionyl-CoA synthetase [Phaeovibrio sulfidiphilus]